MARVDRKDLKEAELEQFYIAETVDQATRVESILTDAGIDYVVEMESYLTIPTLPELGLAERQGAFFYVLSAQVPLCRTLLSEAGLSRGFIE